MICFCWVSCAESRRKKAAPGTKFEDGGGAWHCKSSELFQVGHDTSLLGPMFGALWVSLASRCRVHKLCQGGGLQNLEWWQPFVDVVVFGRVSVHVYEAGIR